MHDDITTTPRHTRTVALSVGLSTIASLFTAIAVVGIMSAEPAHPPHDTPSALSVAEEGVPHHADSEPVVTVVEKANDAVVSIVVTRDVLVLEQYFERIDPFGFGPFGYIEVPRVREQGTEEREVGGGTGFFVSPDGLIITNRHVVQETDARYSILLNDGTRHDVDVLVRDPQLDIAVLKVEEVDIPPEGFTYLTFGSSATLRPGQTVIAIGNALSEFRNSVSVGVVSGLSRSVVASDRRAGRTELLEGVIQTDAAINPGNSGGPLLDLSGTVVGVNVARTGGAENIGFALPSDLVASVVESVMTYGEIRRPFLGVRYIELNQSIAANNELSVDYGAWLRGGPEGPAILKDSPAQRSGLQENDIIIAVAGISLRDRSLGSALREQRVGDTIQVTYLRNGVEHTSQATLDMAPTQ